MVSLFGSGTRRHLAVTTVDDDGSASDDSVEHDGREGSAAVELYDDADTVLHVLPASDPVAHEVEQQAFHYPMATVRPVPLQSRASTPGRASDAATLSSLGLPEHLTPSDGGGLPELLTLLDLLPNSRMPTFRHGDEILVLTTGLHSSSAEQVATSVIAEFAAAGQPVGHATVRVESWPTAREVSTLRTASTDSRGSKGGGRPRSILLRTSPDCSPPTAYRICRSVPGIRLDLWGVQSAERPAAPLAWGAPVAFIDGRPAHSELWAAILADRLAGGVH